MDLRKIEEILATAEKVAISQANNDLERSFGHYDPTPENLAVFQVIRGSAKLLAYVIVDQVPKCKEREIALNMIESTIMWANAGVVRNTIQMGVGTPPPLHEKEEHYYNAQEVRKPVNNLEPAVSKVEVCPACMQVKDSTGCGC